jgi:hypothetical protein
MTARSPSIECPLCGYPSLPCPRPRCKLLDKAHQHRRRQQALRAIRNGLNANLDEALRRLLTSRANWNRWAPVSPVWKLRREDRKRRTRSAMICFEAWYALTWIAAAIAWWML